MTNKHAELLAWLKDTRCDETSPCLATRHEEAAEAFSSLIEALERIANHFDMDGYEGDAWKALALEMAEVARAALNSDAPLSIGEGL